MEFLQPKKPRINCWEKDALYYEQIEYLEAVCPSRIKCALEY